jgi:hypothetical protein
MPGLIRGVARTAVIAGTATSVSNRVSRRQASRWAAQEQQSYEQDPPPPAAPAEEDMTAQLQKLATLHEQGVLTDEEFAAKKKQILGL